MLRLAYIPAADNSLLEVRAAPNKSAESFNSADLSLAYCAADELAFSAGACFTGAFCSADDSSGTHLPSTIS